MDTEQFKCDRCQYIWSYSHALISDLGCCKKCITDQEEYERFVPWITTIFEQFSTGVAMKSKIIKELIGEYFDRVNEKEKNKV